MRRSDLIRLAVVLIALVTAISLFACKNNPEETEGVGSKETESVTELGSDADTSEESDSGNAETLPGNDESKDESESKDEGDDPGDENKCEHPYSATHDGHWKPACPVCGKPEGKLQSHDYEEKVEDEGDLLLYSLRCKVCRFRAYEQEVPYEINGFYSAGELAFTDASGSLTGNFGFGAGMGYATYTPTKEGEGGSVTINVKSNGQVEEPSGKYLVMKVRTAASQSSFKVEIRSVGAYEGARQVLNFTGLKSGWVTVIVDLTKANSVQSIKDKETGISREQNIGYHPDASGEYYLGDFRIVASAGAGESFDVGYVMFCDDIEDATNFSKGDTTYLYEDVLNKAPIVNVKECVDENGNPIKHEYVVHDDGTHSLPSTCYQCGLAAVSHEPHKYSQIQLENGDLAYACSACGYSRFGEGVSVNKYYDANALNSDAKNYFRNTKNGVLIDEEGKFTYASFSGNGNTAQIIFSRNTADSSDSEKAATFTVGTAKYFVIRMKTNKSSMNYTFTFATEAAEWIEGKHNGEVKGMFPRVSAFNLPISVGGDDQWNTYVMDLSTLIPNSWVADESGNHTVYTFYCNIGGVDYTQNVNINFEYMAFVDNWDEVAAIVSDETFINVSASGVGNVVNTNDRSCVGSHAGNTVETETGYKVECGTCGKLIKEITVPKEVNYYTDLGSMNKYSTGSLEKFLYDEENDVLYNRYEGFAASHLNITGGTGAGTWTTDKYMTGEYLVIKYRMQGANLGLFIATKDYGTNPNYTDATRPFYSSLGERSCPAGLSYWSVALIKIPDGADMRFTKGEEQEIGIMFTVGNSPYIVDIAYMAIVDSRDEAELLLEEGEVLEDLGQSWKGTITEVMPEAPDSDEPEEGKVYEVTELGPDKLASPPENTTGTFDFTKMEEDGVSFVRINNINVNKDGWAGINYVNSSNSVKGRYFAMKFRIGDNGLDQNFIKLYTGTTGSLVGEGQGVAFKVVEGGEWCVIVVDLLQSIGDKGTYMVKGQDGSYTLRYFGIRPFSNNQKGAVGTDAYMDIAYIKFFEHKSQIKDVVDMDTYEMSVDRSTNTTLRTEDNSCITCSITETFDGEKYMYVCTSCGKVHKTVEIPESVTKYYSANDIATGAKNYYGPNGGVTSFANEDGVIYAQSKNMLQIIWQRVMADMDGKHTSGKEQHFSESVGNAKYLVIKARTSGANGYLNLLLSTDAYNAPLKVATENMAGYCKGHTGQKDEWEENGEIKKGVLAGGEYRSAVGYKGVYIIPTGAGDGEWQTYVIDIAALYGEVYAKKDGSNEYIVDSFFMNFGGDVDVSYIAFVEGDMTDVADLVDEDEVANITAVNGTYEIVSLSK